MYEKNVKHLKFLLNEYIKFYEAHNGEIGALDLKNFRQYIYIYYNDSFILSCALTDTLFNEYLKEIRG